MTKPAYMVITRFLGAGKTTSMIAMARAINRKYGKGGIIANDLGAKNLVDADLTRMADVEISEIIGDCICYVTEDLVFRIDGLVNDGCTVVMSDIPESGLGSLDHVVIKIKEDYPDKYELLPLTCIVDPERLRMILSERANINLPEEMRFLLNAQIVEADLIVLNKVDMLYEDELAADLEFIRTAYPDIPVMCMSARTGEGDDYVKASLIGVDYDIEYDRKLEKDYTAMVVIVNARALCESGLMAEIMDDAIDSIKERHNLKCQTIFTECFGFFDEGRRNGGRVSRL